MPACLVVHDSDILVSAFAAEHIRPVDNTGNSDGHTVIELYSERRDRKLRCIERKNPERLRFGIFVGNLRDIVES